MERTQLIIEVVLIQEVNSLHYHHFEHMRSLLNSLIGQEVSAKTWFDFWSFFNEKPYLYKKLKKKMIAFGYVDKAKVARDRISEEELVLECSEILKLTSKIKISKDLRNGIGSSSLRNQIHQKIQKPVQ